MPENYRPTLALFYCRNVPNSNETIRRGLEKKCGEQLRLFPLPCSGRLEAFHLLRALEEFADAAYLVACPEGVCRYFEGNKRARKRVQRTQDIIADIGLERKRVGIIVGSSDAPKSLAEVAEELLEAISAIEPSPVLRKANG